MKSKTRQPGFSLIELMIALVAGLIVVGALLTFTVASVRANAQTVQATRLTQDLRTTMSLLVRELRRAGHDRTAESRVGTSTNSSRFTGLTVSPDGDCVVLAYSRLDHSDATPRAGEWRAFRRVEIGGVGVVQANFQSNPPVCGSNDGWVEVTNPRQVNITALNFDATASNSIIAGLPVGIDSIGIRQVALTLSASLVSDPVVVRTVTEAVRVRADEVVFTPPVVPTP
jgi:prepilin-type N-terminal cleavage/methylation domain-containing protein